MLISFILISFIFVLIWSNYFREIELAPKEKFPLLIFSFLMGCVVFYPFHLINEFLPVSFCNCNEIVNHALVSFIKKGLLSEIFKLLPIYLLYLLFRKEIKEPVSIFLFFCITALGFSFSENISFALKTNALIVDERVLLTFLNEMFCSSLISFAVVNYRFYSKKISDIIIMLFLSALLSGFFDFWVYYERLNPFGFLFTIFYFLIMVSIFVQVLTNSINVSSDFSYLRIDSKKKLVNKFNRFYLLIFVLQFLILAFQRNILNALENLGKTLFFSGLILFLVSLIVSKLRLIEGRWTHPKLKLPFSFYYSEQFNGRKPKLKIKLIGETFNESAIDFYLENVASINPLSKRNSFIISSKNARIKRKLFLKNDEVFYEIEILNDSNLRTMLLKPKTSGKIFVKRRHAIAALLSIPEDLEDFSNKKNTIQDFVFREWVYIKYR